METATLVSAGANIVMAIGILFIFYQTILLKRQLHADHERSRRETTVQLIQQWSRSITPVTSAAQWLVQKFDKEQCRKLADLLPLKVKAEHMALLETCLADVLGNERLQEENGFIQLNERCVTRLRYLVVEYLNETEAVLLAWHISIADRELVEREFQCLVRPEKGMDALENLREAFGGKRAFPAIDAFAAKIRKATKSGTEKGKAPVV